MIEKADDNSSAQDLVNFITSLDGAPAASEELLAELKAEAEKVNKEKIKARIQGLQRYSGLVVDQLRQVRKQERALMARLDEIKKVGIVILAGGEEGDEAWEKAVRGMLIEGAAPTLVGQSPKTASVCGLGEKNIPDNPGYYKCKAR